MQLFGEPHERERREREEAHGEERRAPQRNSLNLVVCLSSSRRPPYIGGRGSYPHQGT
jgi:hypothetical protein